MRTAALVPLFLPLLAQLAASQGPAPPVGGTWVLLGEPPLTDAPVICTQLAFDRAGACHVAFQDDGADQDRASVLVHDGDGGWSFLGARGGASHGRAWYNHVAIDGADRVHVVSRDYLAPGSAGVRVFDPAAGAWADLGSGFSPFDAHHTHLALDAGDRPWVVFVDGASTPQGRARVVRWTGAAWVHAGVEHASRGAANYTSVAHVGGEAWVAFAETDHGARVSVMRLDAATGRWKRVGLPGFSTGLAATNVRLAVSPAGVAHVAYLTYPDTVWVERWTGADWQALGGPASGTDKAVVETDNWRQWLSLDFDTAGRPTVAYQDGNAGSRLTVRRFDGVEWVALGSPAFTPERADYHALALDARGTPHVSFRNGGLLASLAVMRFVEGVETYCTAKVASHGFAPRIGFEGVPSSTPPDDFAVTAAGIPPGVPGMLLWSLAPDAKPHLGGTLCVRAPVQRTGVQSSGAAATFGFAFSEAYRSAQGIVAGTRVYAQWWFRDGKHPDGTGAGLTDGLAFQYRP